MAILLTGGLGFIGSHTAVQLLNAENDVVIIDNLSNSETEVLRRIRKITGKSPKFYEGDIISSETLDIIFLENKIESVVHFAGLKAVGESTEQPLIYYKNNVSGTINLLQTMERYNVHKIVFSSSATIYGSPKSNPIHENYARSATNPYGRTKLIIEQIIEDLDHEKWNAIILRYFNPIGAHPSGLIGESPLGEPNNLIPIVLKVANSELKCLKVFGDNYDTPDGTAIRDYIHVVDLSDAHVKSIDLLSSRPYGLSIFNIGTGRPHSVLEVIDIFEKVNNISIPHQFVERRQGDVGECWADCSKSNRGLKWRSHFGIEDMLKHAWKWKSKNPSGYLSVNHHDSDVMPL